MKIAYSWLQEYLDIQVSPKDLGEKKLNVLPLKLIPLPSLAMA